MISAEITRIAWRDCPCNRLGFQHSFCLVRCHRGILLNSAIDEAWEINCKLSTVCHRKKADNHRSGCKNAHCQKCLQRNASELRLMYPKQQDQAWVGPSFCVAAREDHLQTRKEMASIIRKTTEPNSDRSLLVRYAHVIQ